MDDTTPSASLVERTLNLLTGRSRSATYQVIASRADLTVAWIQAFRCGQLDEPSVHKVQRLHDALIALKS